MPHRHLRARPRPQRTHPVGVELHGAHAHVELVGEAEELVVGVQRRAGEVVQRPADVLEVRAVHVVQRAVAVGQADGAVVGAQQRGVAQRQALHQARLLPHRVREPGLQRHAAARAHAGAHRVVAPAAQFSPWRWRGRVTDYETIACCASSQFQRGGCAHQSTWVQLTPAGTPRGGGSAPAAAAASDEACSPSSCAGQHR